MGDRPRSFLGIRACDNLLYAQTAPSLAKTGETRLSAALVIEEIVERLSA